MLYLFTKCRFFLKRGVHMHLWHPLATALILHSDSAKLKYYNLLESQKFRSEFSL